MSYIALYRKWRPGSFDDIKGQDAIATTLRNQILAGRIGHAYLFCGTRGTGKTSAAKVFAKAVNCTNPQNGNPCGECASCKSIAAGNSMNVIEMDAASNNGVDDVRQIKEDITYSPTDAKYKVYIIDEVHMMSKEAFNALLKTLEEPPSYVIFLLATTDPQKLPVTILSRVQRYDFKRISTEIIEERLKEVATNENINIEDKAVEYIAKTAEGGMRDALSLLDQCASFFLDKEITYERALDVLGAVDTAVFSEFLRNIVARSVIDSIGIIDRILIQGRDLNQFVIDFTWYLRNVLMIKTAKDASEVVDVTKENLELIKKEAQAIPEEVILRYIRVFSELSNDLRYATQKRVLVEIAIVKLCKPQMEKNILDSLSDRLRIIEDLIENGNLSADSLKEGISELESSKSHGDSALIKRETNAAMELPTATKEDLAQITAVWKDVCRVITDMRSVLSGGILRMSVPSVRPSDGMLVIQVADATQKELCDGDLAKSDLNAAFEKVLGKKVEFEFVATNEASENGQYFPPISIFGGMEVEIDDNI